MASITDDTERGFYAYPKGDDWEARYEEIAIGVYFNGGGCVGEFSIRWEELARNEFTPKLVAWDDSWSILFSSFSDLIEEMRKIKKPISLKEFTNILIGLNIKDLTENG